MSLLPPHPQSYSNVRQYEVTKFPKTRQKCQTFKKVDTSNNRTKSFSPIVSANYKLYRTLNNSVECSGFIQNQSQIKIRFKVL